MIIDVIEHLFNLTAYPLDYHAISHTCCSYWTQLISLLSCIEKVKAKLCDFFFCFLPRIITLWYSTFVTWFWSTLIIFQHFVKRNGCARKNFDLTWAKHHLWQIYGNFVHQNQQIPLSASQPTILDVIHCPPQNSVGPSTEDFDRALLFIEQINAKFHFTGDFNLDLSSYTIKHKASLLINTPITHSAFPIVNQPTRVTKCSSTLIDNYISNDTRLLFNSKTYITQIVFDHYPISVMIKHSIRPNSTVSPKHYKILELNDITSQSLRSELARIDWNTIMNADNCSDNYHLFYSKFLEVMHHTLFCSDSSVSRYALHTSTLFTVTWCLFLVTVSLIVMPCHVLWTTQSSSINDGLGVINVHYLAVTICTFFIPYKRNLPHINQFTCG